MSIAQLANSSSMEGVQSEGLPYHTLINSLIHKYAEGGRSRQRDRGEIGT